MMAMTCPLTGIMVNFDRTGSLKYYDVEIAGNEVTIFLCGDCERKFNTADIPQHIIKGLIANKKWPKTSFVVSRDCTLHQESVVHSEKVVLPDFLKSAMYPKSPSEKMDNLFVNLFRRQKQDGELVCIDLRVDSFPLKNYFRNEDECRFYILGLREEGLITLNNEATQTPSFRITHLGLNKAVKLLDEGDKSNNCFIAMAFNEKTEPFRQAIKKALGNTGFKAVIIDEEHLQSDKTIPDGILSGIKKSKFCIADFSYHRNGVYFESGYALGLGKPVIYLCSESEFKDAHFDIKQLQHLIYSTPEELEKRLTEKIEAWIL